MSREGSKYTGEFGAQGKTGGEAIAARLDQLAAEGGLTTFYAKVKYLTGSAEGYAAMERAGVEAKQRRTIETWLSDYDSTAKPANMRAVDKAYREQRHHNVARSLKNRLKNGGAGTQVEIYPTDQTPVVGGRKRDLNMRRVTIRPGQWDALVDAWERDNTSDMDLIYEGVIEESIGSDWAAYSWVSSIGFSA